MTRRKIALSVAVLAALALAVLLLTGRWSTGGRGAAHAGEPGAGAAGTRFDSRVGPARGAPLPADAAALVEFLRARYGKHLANRYVQLQMIEKLMRHFQAKNPAGWREELLAALRDAFPERYAELAANLQHRLDYEAWLDAHRARLAGLGERERRDAIWEERKRLFGEEAANEIWASERKNQGLAAALSAIDADPDASLRDRLAQYQAALEEAHPENPALHAQNHGQDLDRFLALDSVQQELAAMSAADRVATLREVRKGLGLDDAALDRWTTLDRERDQRWEAGRAYMAARAELTAQYTGDALEQKLAELRARYFGAEAATIAEEEASGFFRFDRPRRHGLN